MSATFKIAKKQYTQNDLRRLMQEQRSKNKQSAESQCKVNSPLAKYNDSGQLMCILCKSIVRSESVWKVHINTKAHKENVEAAKKLKEKLQTTSSSVSHKRHGEEIHQQIQEIPEKKIKVEKPVSLDTFKEEKINTIPPDFFDSNDKNKYFKVTLNKTTTIKKDLVNIKRDQSNSTDTADNIQMEVDESRNELLPEGFFDDPVKDAKIRNLEYKDPHEEEWERFQKEIKEESTVSNAIIAEEQEEATTERQIEEIDEQILKWSRVLDLEKKKENICAKVKQKAKMRMDDSSESESNDSDDDKTDIDDLLDWRAKRLEKIQR